jgi:addiction module RelE/StbE family toxin
MYKIKLTAKAKNELKKLSQKNQLSLGHVIEELKDNPLSGKPLNRELISKYSYRVGVYRIIYKINKKDNIVTIISAGHLATIYE